MDAVLSVVNSGKPGDNSNDLVARFDKDVASCAPDLVIIMIGTNDALYPGHQVDGRRFAANLEELIDKCRALYSDVILLNSPPCLPQYVIPMLDGTADPNAKIRERNSITEKVAAETGIPFGDVYSAVAVLEISEGDGSVIMNEANSGRHDGFHLTAAGYAAVAAVAYGLVEKQSRKYKKILCLGDSLTHGVYLKGRGSACADAETYPGQLYKLLKENE